MHIRRVLSVLLLSVTAIGVRAQPRQPVPPFEALPSVPPLRDSIPSEEYYTLPASDSARIFDSIYALRRAEMQARVRERPYVPKQDFLSLRIASSAFARFRAREMQRYFAERVGRSDLESEGSSVSGLDRMLSLMAAAQLSNSLGVFAQYSFTARYYQTNVTESPDPGRVPLGRAELDLVCHDFVVGPSVIPFSSSFVAVKLFAGLGPALLNVREFEGATNSERTASAAGLALAFEAELDFRVIDELSFGLSLFTKQVSAGKPAIGDADLSAPFGFRDWETVTRPDAGFATVGLGLGLRYYF